MQLGWHTLNAADRDLIARHQAELPVKLGALAKELGVRVLSSTLPSGISGEIRPRDGSFVISVNRHDSARRQRFTVAHELAHYLLHRDQIGAGIQDDVLYRSNLSDQREAEANRLAAEILMPREKIDRALADVRDLPESERIPALSERFGVSDVAMRIRLGLA